MTARGGGGSTVGVVGASGYSGAVAARLLAAHPALDLRFCTSDKLVGKRVDEHLGVPCGDLRFAANGDALELGSAVDAVLLATSAEVSAKLAPALLAAGRRVVDFSGAFRLGTADLHARWYGFEHPAPELLEVAHYGLPELFGPPPDGARLVANPGCYPTATLLALAPLVRAGLVEPEGLIVDAKSGVSGAGRQAKEEYSFVELDEDLRAYKLLTHQHTPEIARGLKVPRLTFTAHLLPVKRGLLATCYARPRAGTTAKHVTECLADAYAGRPFVQVVGADQVRLTSVTGTNLARVGAVADDGVVIAIGAIDNLLKGAAGQALQNVNRLLGQEETAGLTHLFRAHP